MNDKFVQITGPFTLNEEIVDKIKAETGFNFLYIKKIGIQTEPASAHKVSINGQIFEIGKTGILEFNEVQITSLNFLQDETSFTIIDLIVGE